MADLTLNTKKGETIAREKLIAYLNTGEVGEPTWSPIGKRITDSSMAYDWSRESSKDILGETYSTMKKPELTQDFEPAELDSGDSALVKIWNLAVVQQDAQALANQDMLIVHYYGDATKASFAERYTGCAIEVSELGGEGGGTLQMPFSVTYGGTRSVGKVTGDPDAPTFVAGLD